MKPPNPLSLVKFESDKLLRFTDPEGTLLLGIEGANQAISGNLDFSGVMVLAFATALAGGMIRDLFFMHHFGQAIAPNAIVILDAAGWHSLPGLEVRKRWTTKCTRS